MSRVSQGGLLGGFNHAKYISSDDIAQDTSGSTTVLTMPVFGIPAGGVVQDVALHLVTPFSGGSNVFLNITVGDNTDPDGFVTAQDYYDSGDDGTSINTGIYFNDATTANTVNGKLYTSKDTVDVVITASSALATLNTGAFLVLANILDPSAYIPR